MILRLHLLLAAIAGALAVREDTSFAFTGYGNVFGGGISAPGSSSYEPLQTAAAEPVPQKAAVARPASSVTVLEKPSRLRLARPPAVHVLPTAAAPAGQVSVQAPGTSTVTTYPAGAQAVTFQRPLIYAAPPPLQYVAAAPQQVYFAQHGSVGVAAPPATATKTVVAAAAAPADPATAKAKTATATGATAGATVTSAGAAVVTSAKPTAVTVSRPVAVTYPPAQTYLFQRPAYAYPGAAATAGVQAPVQVTYMRPLYQQTPYGLQPAGFAPAASPVYQRPLVAYQHGAAAAPLTVAYPGALRTLAGAPGVFAAPHVAMPFAAAAPLVSAVHGAAAAPVAGMPAYGLARQVIAPFPGNVAVARPQLTYAQPAYGAPLSYGHGAALTYAPAAVQPTQVLRPAKSKK
ncbi:ice-structuring glycoprotein-like [Rhipicephalus sanguineus]|uniref:ice-structuring glycoprotein-like n=1 Tax=Rhipicephalus sanguineus TaxID=34632 RepID=UPI0018961430|nr:ice-structuring glycoprotein-like [Rhipicephalus sanguineus]